MEYIEIHLHISPKNKLINDILASNLGESGFESFIECEDGMLAYIPTSKFDEKSFTNTINEHFMGSEIRVTKDIIPDQDWNEEWEKNAFEPIIINQECVIHSSTQQHSPSVTSIYRSTPECHLAPGITKRRA